MEYERYSAGWWREYRLKNLDRLRAYRRQYDRLRYKTHYATELGRRLKWQRSNPVKVKAHKAVEYAIRIGRLVRSTCSVCGFAGRVVAHHDDYGKPLEVIWLCEIHHKARHRTLLGV